MFFCNCKVPFRLTALYSEFCLQFASRKRSITSSIYSCLFFPTFSHFFHMPLMSGEREEQKRAPANIFFFDWFWFFLNFFSNKLLFSDFYDLSVRLFVRLSSRLNENFVFFVVYSFSVFFLGHISYHGMIVTKNENVS